MQQFVQFQHELKVNYCQLVTVMAEPPVVQAAFRAGLASNRHFYPMKNERLFSKLISTGETEGEYAERSQPYTFVLRPDLIIYKNIQRLVFDRATNA